MFFKFIIALSAIVNVSACPAAKKANLREEGKKTINSCTYRSVHSIQYSIILHN